MNVAQTLPFADTWGTNHPLGAAWWIPMLVMMVVFWGAMMLFGSRLMRGGMCWPWQRSPGEPPAETSETPVDLLDRRFAEGTISVEDYQARRKLLAELADQTNGTHADQALIAPGASEGSQS